MLHVPYTVLDGAGAAEVSCCVGTKTLGYESEARGALAPCLTLCTTALTLLQSIERTKHAQRFFSRSHRRRPSSSRSRNLCIDRCGLPQRRRSQFGDVECDGNLSRSGEGHGSPFSRLDDLRGGNRQSRQSHDRRLGKPRRFRLRLHGLPLV